MSSPSEVQAETPTETSMEVLEESSSRPMPDDMRRQMREDAPLPLEFRWIREDGSIDSADLRMELYGAGVRPSWDDSEDEEVQPDEEQPVAVEEDIPASIGEEELQHAVEAAREEGFAKGEQEGLRQGRAEMDSSIERAVSAERERLAMVVSEFRRAEERYFTAVEVEVVKLSLAIAARILHREVQLDPLLLRSVVRVALEKLEGQGGAVLHVPEADVSAWKQIFGLETRVDVVADPALSAGQCVLNTKVGKVELGIVEQLQEIERGFFDLLSHRPRMEPIE